MNQFHSVYFLLASLLLLSGCAELTQLTSKSGVPIEERNSGVVVTQVKPVTGKPSDTSAGTKTPAGKQATAAPATEKSGPVVAPVMPAAEPVAETLPLPTAAASETTLVNAPSQVRVPRVVGVSPEQAAKLIDPASMLSKRVILFDYDSEAIGGEYRDMLEAHAEFLSVNGAARVILQGHTDERGTPDHNVALGQRRSESLKQALMLMGVQADQLETVSFGEEKPAQEGHDEAAWRMNRRAEILYQGE